MEKQHHKCFMSWPKHQCSLSFYQLGRQFNKMLFMLLYCVRTKDSVICRSRLFACTYIDKGMSIIYNHLPEPCSSASVTQQ